MIPLFSQGSEIFTVIAKDGDVGNPNPIRYAFDEGKVGWGWLGLKDWDATGWEVAQQVVVFQATTAFFTSTRRVVVSPSRDFPSTWNGKYSTLKSGWVAVTCSSNHLITCNKWLSITHTHPSCSGIRSESTRQTLGLQCYYRGDPRGGPEQQPAYVLWGERPTEHVWADHVWASTGGRDPARAENHGQRLGSGELINPNSITPPSVTQERNQSLRNPSDFLSKLVI